MNRCWICQDFEIATHHVQFYHKFPTEDKPDRSMGVFDAFFCQDHFQMELIPWTENQCANEQVLILSQRFDPNGFAIDPIYRK